MIWSRCAVAHLGSSASQNVKVAERITSTILSIAVLWDKEKRSSGDL